MSVCSGAIIDEKLVLLWSAMCALMGGGSLSGCHYRHICDIEG
ncbi:MAG: hypothetical protein V7K40_15320 [Nostoc sp.]